MVQLGMDTVEPPAPLMLRTKDFAAVCGGEPGAPAWYITSVRMSRMFHAMGKNRTSPIEVSSHEHEPERVRYGTEDVPSMWLLDTTPQGLLVQFYSHERRRYEAADEDEAYALLVHVQKTFSHAMFN